MFFLPLKKGQMMALIEVLLTNCSVSNERDQARRPSLTCPVSREVLIVEMRKKPSGKNPRCQARAFKLTWIYYYVRVHHGQRRRGIVQVAAHPVIVILSRCANAVAALKMRRPFLLLIGLSNCVTGQGSFKSTLLFSLSLFF